MLLGKYISFGDFVFGDVYEFSDLNLIQFLSDGFLFMGDCIVNESMLIGKGFLYLKDRSFC